MQLGNLLYFVYSLFIWGFADRVTAFFQTSLYFLYFLCTLFYDLWTLMEKINLWQKFNNRKTHIFNTNDRKETISVIEWKNLKKGDIVILHNDEEAPADLVLLDSNESLCYFDTRFIDGKKDIVKKCPLKSTKTEKSSFLKGNIEDYKNILSGRLEFNFSLDDEKNDTNYFGTIKLQKEPKIEEFDNRNVVFQGSILKCADWAYGITLNVGAQAKIFNYFGSSYLYKRVYLDWKINVFVLLTISFILIFSTLSSFIAQYVDIGKNNSLLHFDYSFMMIISRISQYYPVSIHFIVAFASIIYRYIIENFYSKRPIPFYFLQPSEANKPQKIEKRLKINNTSILSNLDKVNHVIVNPEVFFIDNPSELRSLLINNVLYSTIRYPEDDDKGMLDSNSKSSLLSSNDEINPLFNTYYQKTNKDIFETSFTKKMSCMSSRRCTPTYLEENDIGRFLTDDETIYQQEDIFKAMALCHGTKTKVKKNGDIRYDYLNQDEQRAIEYASLRGFHFEGTAFSKSNSEYKCYNLTINWEPAHFPVLCPFTANRKKNKFCIVIQDFNDEETEKNSAVLYLKSNDIAILEKLDLEPDYLLTLKKFLTTCKYDGLRFMVYCKKNLEPRETFDIIQKTNIFKSKVGNSSIHFDDIFSEFESDLILLTIAFFQDRRQESSKSFITNCKEGKIPIWLLSSFEENDAIPMAYRTKILDKSSEVVDLKMTSINSGMIIFNNLFGKIKNKIINAKVPVPNSAMTPIIKRPQTQIAFHEKEWKDFTFLIDGDSLNILVSDSYLLEHFKFLLGFCKGFLGYEMTQSQKKLFFSLLKDSFPNEMILGVGHNYTDFPMIFESNIGVLIRKCDDKSCLMIEEGDIICEEIELLSDLIFVRSKTIIEKFEVILDFIFYCSYLYSNPISFYFFSSNFLSFFDYDHIQGIFKNLFIPICPLLLYLLNSEDKNEVILSNAPLIYEEKKYRLKKIVQLFFIKIVIRSLIDSTLIYIMFLFNEILESGTMNSFFICVTEVFYANTVFVYMYFFYNIKDENFLDPYCFWFVQYTFYGFFLLFLLKFIEIDIFHETIITRLVKILGYAEHAFIYCFFIFSNWGFNYLLKTYISKYFDGSKYDIFIKKFKEGKKFKEIINYFQGENKKKEQTPIAEITEKSKNFFTKSKMDSTLQDLINPIDLNHDISYQKATLLFREVEFEKKYREKIYKEMLLTLKLTYLVNGIASLTLGFLLFLWIKLNEDNFTTTLMAYALMVCCASFVLQFLVTLRAKKQNTIPGIQQIRIVFAIIINIVLAIFSSEQIDILIYYFMIWHILTSTTLNLDTIKFIVFSSLVNIFILILKIIIDPIFSPYFKTLLIVGAVFYAIIIFSFRYIMEKTNRDVFLSENKIHCELKKINDILTILVPEFVKNLFLRGIYTLSEEQPNVAILFCDIYEFDKIVATENNNIIRILDNLYRAFDQICLENSVQKIETVGKTYMACSGFKRYTSTNSSEYNTNPTAKVLEMALQINNYVKTLTWGEEGKKITLKMGIHYGKVIAGVIGEHKPQFSLIGDTVNTTSRVCSTSDIGIITLSEEAYLKIKDSFPQCEFKLKEVEAKGKGVLKTYQLIKSSYRKRKKLVEKSNSGWLDGLKKNDENVLKVLEIGKSINDEKLRETNSEQENIFQKMISYKEKSFTFPLDPRQTIVQEECKSKNTKLNVSERGKLENYLSINSGSINSFDFEEIKQTDLFSQYKTNFFRFKKMLGNELLENPESLQKKIEIKMISYSGNPNEADFQERKTKNSVDIKNFSPKKNSLKEMFREQSSLVDEKIQLLTIKNSFFLLFDKKVDNFSIEDYEQNTLNFGGNVYKMSLLMYAIIATIFLWQIFLYGNHTRGYVYMLIGRIIHILTPLVVMKFYKFILTRHKKKFLFVIFMQSIYFFVFLFDQTDWSSNFAYLLEAIFYLNTFLILHNIYFVEAFIFIVSLCFVFVGFIIFHDFSNIVYWAEFIVAISNFIFLLFKIREKHARCIQQFNTLKTNLHHKKRQENLITYLLPPHIFLAFTQNKTQNVDNLDDVTILFADIAGFTKYSSSVSSLEVLSMLRQLFTEFDKLCLNYKIYKLYTIGDCYVILGVLDIYYRDPILELFKVLMAGFDMINIIANVKKRINFSDLNMRIGIHTGKIIGGILGTDIVRYDIYGRDVLIANKMESNGEAGKINVSENTKNIIMKNFPDNFMFQENTEVFISSLNEKVKSYFVYNYHEVF